VTGLFYARIAFLVVLVILAATLLALAVRERK
jgi:hypothetical protein